MSLIQDAIEGLRFFDGVLWRSLIAQNRGI